MSGTLYLCATPIGNLEDITFRVINTLKEVDLIAAEDTRHSIKLLNHFEIKTKMTSYHEYNRVEKAKVLVKQLQEGKNIALITDAGTPGISDPGEELVRQCHEAGITVTALPGACALINALIISGQPTRRFCFEAFLPADKKERKQILDTLENETRSIIIYEAPHRLVRTLEELHEVLGDRSMTLCRELTKKHESVFKSTLGEILAYHRENRTKRRMRDDHRRKIFSGIKRRESGRISKDSIVRAYETIYGSGIFKERSDETGSQRSRCW